MKKIEILSPAGSYESMEAAIAAGADAVYIGGSKFGARAFANNLTQDELLRAIDDVHLHGRKLYLTVNTLLKENEITKELYEYIKPLYLQGLDAVIVQDIGVLKFIKMHFPGLSIHASTQMTITNVLGAKFLEKQGVERVVTARELNVREIKEIAEETSLEIESFVHGALCYCYSGQCLYSSLIGGRSGNRGQCAQPCRLPYEVEGRKGKSYVLSLKDICTLDTIPELLEAGITSLKIEGRMKKPEYVAAVTAMYRKYVDLYLCNGKKDYKVTKEDKEIVMDLYNRGGFHEGYYHTHNGPDMISLTRSNHAGVEAVKVVDCQGRTLTGTALIHLCKGDVIEIPNQQNDYTLGQDIAKGGVITLCLGNKTQISKATILNRTRNEHLLNEIRTHIIHKKNQEKIKGKLILSTKNPSTLMLQWNNVQVVVEGDIAEVAQNQPMESTRVEQQMRKTGNTKFVFEELDIVLDGQVFMPMQKLNELRRQGIQQLEETICKNYRRTLEEPTGIGDSLLKVEELNKTDSAISFIAYVETMEQLQTVFESGNIRCIYVDCNIVRGSYKDTRLKELIVNYHDRGGVIYYVMPHIFRTPTKEIYERFFQSFLEMKFDGIVIRNYESFEFLTTKNYELPIVLDHNMYTFNHYSKEFWRENHIASDTAPLELNYKELKNLNMKQTQLIAYGYLPMMVSAQCIQKTTSGCSHKQGNISLQDRFQKKFLVKNCCEYCYNIIYNSAPLLLLDQGHEIEQLKITQLRLQFTIEDAVTTRKIIQAFDNRFVKGTPQEDVNIEFTRGHFKRGIK